MIVALGQVMTREQVIHEALDRSIGGAGWIVTPKYPEVAWSVTPQFFYRVVETALRIANEKGAEYGYRFTELEIVDALVMRGYKPSRERITVTAPTVTPLPTGVIAPSPVIRTSPVIPESIRTIYLPTATPTPPPPYYPTPTPTPQPQPTPIIYYLTQPRQEPPQIYIQQPPAEPAKDYTKVIAWTAAAVVAAIILSG